MKRVAAKLRGGKPGAAKLSAPATHAMLWLVCVLLVLFLHIPYLRLPYFWDEAGYYFPAALDLAQHGHLLPQNTVVNPHPPMLSIYLAAIFKIFGYAPIVTRIAMCLVAGTALYAMLIVAALLIPAGSGVWAAGLLAFSPVFFAQSTMAHLDVAATAAALFTIYFYLRGRITGYLIAATILCMTRETGAALVILLAVLARNPVMLAPLLPLAGWFAFLRVETGRWLGDPNFVSYNLWTTLNPLRFIVSLLRRIQFVFFVDFRWMLTIPALWVLWKSRRLLRFPQGRPAYQLLWLVLALQLAVMSLFGGALLNRYLLTALAVFYLLSLEALERLNIKHRRWGLLLLLLAQIGCWFWNPPYPFPLEDNLAYADFVNLHESAADRVHQLRAGTRILTAWPATAELSMPEIGYVNAPIATKIVPMEDFSEQSFAKIARDDFDVVFMFSMEWRPEFDLLRVIPGLERIRENLYQRRPQQTPEWVRFRYQLLSRGRVNLRGQWVEWLEPDPRWRAHPEVYEGGGRGKKVTFVLH